jgi:hypothetical protein
MTALSKTGQRRLADAEAKIERGLSTFMEVGTALVQIRDERLYREQHDTFEEYCRNRWRFSARRANQLMDAAEIGTIVPVANEGQARALKGLDVEQTQEVYETAEAAGDTTAKGLAAARRKVAGEAEPEPQGTPGDPSPALTSEGDAPRVAPSSASPSVHRDPALRLMADLSARRAEVAKWLAFDRHEQVMDSMDPEQRADYRSFVHSVWQHASETLDRLDNPARLKAVQ